MQTHEQNEMQSEEMQYPKAGGEALPDAGGDGRESPDPVSVLHAQKSLVEHLCRMIAKRWIEIQADATKRP